MADCCCTGPDQSEGSVTCHVCGTSSKAVESLTVKALLTEAALARYEHAAYRFCPDAACAIVYFAEGGPTFTTDDVRERVWQKEPPGRRTLCYCFGENEADITREIEQTGQSAAVHACGRTSRPNAAPVRFGIREVHAAWAICRRPSNGFSWSARHAYDWAAAAHWGTRRGQRFDP